MLIPARPCDSSAFSDHVGMKAALDRALQFYNRGMVDPVSNSIDFDMERTIGAGFHQGGETYATTSYVRAVFRHGQIMTIYPLL
jgi:hypothetical protein